VANQTLEAGRKAPAGIVATTALDDVVNTAGNDASCAVFPTL